ncbi:transporter substrate-binding domain-containing protein [Paenibacillus darwinianus]|nr:transporter substrate-binding domain-containing protein [Paenibacillus darwinianus]
MLKKSILSIAALVMIVSLLAGCGGGKDSTAGGSAGDIKVGVLFSLSGSLAVTEKGMANAALLAIEEINAAGGINGRSISAVQEDYASEPSGAATKAKKLLQQDKVAAIVGGYTSASRQAMLPIVEQANGVLVYPTFYEGQEYSKNIIYTGATPNQQLQEFVPWLMDNVGKKVYFIGSDYVYPVETNKQVKELLKLNGGEVVGEEYVPLGQSEFASVINKIKEAAPDVIFSDLVGDSVAAFYKQYKSYGLDPAVMPIASPVTAESEVVSMGADVAAGHISSSAYFQTVDTPENAKFVEAYRAKYGENEPITQVIEATYFSTLLLAEALKKAEDVTDAEAVIGAFAGLEMKAPQGTVKIDPENNHAWLNSRIGKVGADGQFEIVQSTSEPIYPEPWAKILYPEHEKPWKK